MRNTRHYNLDAYRNISDLREKVNAKFCYNNLLMTCYDASILLLHDMYASLKRGAQDNSEVCNVELLVEAIDDLQYGFAKSIKYYDCLYHTYCLVYGGYLQASAIDVNRGIDCLRSIIKVYVKEIPIEKLVELYAFQFPNEPMEEVTDVNEQTSRESIANILALYTIPIVTY